MKKILRQVSLISLFLLISYASCFAAGWTINSVDIDPAYAGIVGPNTIHYIKADLSSDGSAETDIDLWTVLQATLSSSEKGLVGTGGLLHSITFMQGTDWNGSADFNITVYNGYHVPIVTSLTIDYDESGATISGVTTTGGYYDIQAAEGCYPPLAGGLIIDVGDIGDSGDDIILIFGILPKGPN